MWQIKSRGVVSLREREGGQIMDIKCSACIIRGIGLCFHLSVGERESEQVIKCRYCKEQGLVLSTINADYSCEYCGEWQGATLNSAWLIEREGAR